MAPLRRAIGRKSNLLAGEIFNGVDELDRLQSFRELEDPEDTHN